MFDDPNACSASISCSIENCLGHARLESVMSTTEQLQASLPIHAEHFGWIIVDGKWICPQHSGRSNVCSAHIGKIVSELPKGPWTEGEGEEWKDPR